MDEQVKCLNAIDVVKQKHGYHMKFIRCKLTGMNCVCSQFSVSTYQMELMPWYDRCPSYLSTVKNNNK
jgi:hypothetical protein